MTICENCFGLITVNPRSKTHRILPGIQAYQQRQHPNKRADMQFLALTKLLDPVRCSHGVHAPFAQHSLEITRKAQGRTSSIRTRISRETVSKRGSRDHRSGSPRIQHMRCSPVVTNHDALSFSSKRLQVLRRPKSAQRVSILTTHPITVRKGAIAEW